MSITIRAVGHAARRGATRRLPNAATLLGAIDDWLPEASADALRGHVPGTRTGDGAIEATFHPAARPARFEADDHGRVVVTAMTVPVGPGYHTFVARLLERLGDELSVTWAPLATPPTVGAARVAQPAAAADPESSIDPTGTFGSGDRHDAERGHLGWLRSALLAVRDARRERATGLHLATPPGVRFTFDGAVATVLGPRDDAWLERALADPRVAADVWPWVADAMDARYLLGRALTMMWLEVRWRPPASAEEIALVDDVLGLLRRAYPLEPTLAWPWAEWRELFQLRGLKDQATRQLLDRGAGPLVGVPAESEPERIGYRRRPVTIIHEGWALEVPGSFTSTRTAEEWSGGVLAMCGAFAFTGTATGETWNWLALWALIAVGTFFVQATVWTSSVASRFEVSRGLAFAITLSGASLAATLYPVLATWLIGSQGWRAAYASLAGIWALVVFPVLLLFFRGAQDRGRLESAQRAAASSTLSGMTFAEGLRSPTLYKLLMAAGLFAFTAIGVVVHFVPILKDSGASAMSAAGIASLVGVFSIVGRLGTGVLLDKFPAHLVGAAAFLIPIVACMLLLVDGTSAVSQAAAAAIFGLTLGSEVDVIAYLAAKHFGLKNFGALYGVLQMALAVGTAFGPLAAGAVFDRYQSYGPFLMLTTVLTAASAVALFTLNPASAKVEAAGAY